MASVSLLKTGLVDEVAVEVDGLFGLEALVMTSGVFVVLLSAGSALDVTPDVTDAFWEEIGFDLAPGCEDDEASLSWALPAEVVATSGTMRL